MHHTEAGGLAANYHRATYKTYPDNSVVTQILDSETYGWQVEHTTAYVINPHFTVGVKAGINAYYPSFKSEGNYILVPLLLDFKGYLRKRVKTIFLDLGAGYAWGLNDRNYDHSAKGGHVYKTAIGYRFGLSEKLAMTTAFGANFGQRIGVKNPAEYETKPSISGFTLMIGLQY